MGGGKKRHRKSEPSDVAVQPNPGTQLSSVSKDPEAALEHLVSTVPRVLDYKDESLVQCLLGGVEEGFLSEMARYLLEDAGLHKADAVRVSGPPKWNYNAADPFDCFDCYAALGCPNCGSPYELDKPYAFNVPIPALLCFACGHRACRLHFRGESETAPSLRSSRSLLFGSGGATQTSSPAEHLRPVYIRGNREVFRFSENSKSWWQNHFVPEALRTHEADSGKSRLSKQLADAKAPTVKEVCEVCGNEEAFFTTFQARSADEGMTIVYECTKCHNRRTFNN